MIYPNRLQYEIARNKQWHKWFAWYPVDIGNREKAWLEHVERKWTFVPGMIGHVTEYRRRTASDE